MAGSEGGCLCSAVRYRIIGAPRYSVICHCATCRKASGAQSVAWVTFDRENFSWLKGTPKKYSSSAGVTRTFCDQCGTPLTYENVGSIGTLDVTTASTDDPARFPPSMEVWLEHRIEWEAINGALAHCSLGSP
jgi:hypothetical protein